MHTERGGARYGFGQRGCDAPAGFFGPAMLPMSELEYTGITKNLESLDERFRVRGERPTLRDVAE